MAKKSFIERAWQRSPVFTIIGTGIALYGGYWILGRIIGKEKRPPPPKKLPSAGTGIPINWSPRPYATALHSALEGWPGSTTEKYGVYSQLISMTNDQLTAVYNDFNRLYAAEGEGTMTDWIRDESLQPSNTDTMLNRLLMLGLE